MAFIHENFLLGTKTARKLYHKLAEAQPMFDYHCRISPAGISTDRRFKTSSRLGWRAAITNGARCAAMASRKNSSPAARE